MSNVISCQFKTDEVRNENLHRLKEKTDYYSVERGEKYYEWFLSGRQAPRIKMDYNPE